MAWFLSGPLYMPIITLGCITPTTRNVDWLIMHGLAHAGRRCRRGRWPARRRAPPRAASARMSSSFEEAAAGLRDDVAHLAEGRVHAAHARVHRLAGRALTGTRARVLAADAPRSPGCARPAARRPRPWNEIARPGGQAHVGARGGARPEHADALAPIPRTLRWKERFMPSPNESSSTIESVPQAMASTVRAMRLRLRAASCAEELPDQAQLGAEPCASGELQRHHGVEQRGPARGEVAGQRGR